ncbi:MAG: ISAs1 family transposase [Isosphaeraceae bacterium]
MDASSSLMELLAGIPDPRSARGRRHPLPALLALAVVAMLAGVKSYEGFVQFGKERGWAFLGPLGFTTRWGLCKATYSRVFRRIDVAAFEAAVAGWVAARVGPEASRHLALDGKAARGSRDAAAPAAHLVAAYAVGAGAVLAQLRVDAKTNEHKAALASSASSPRRAGRHRRRHVHPPRRLRGGRRGRGDYLLTVKENQPTLLADIKAAFAEPPAGLSPLQADRRAASFDPRGRRGQGARPVGEALTTTTWLAGYLAPDWPVRPGVPDRA